MKKDIYNEDEPIKCICAAGYLKRKADLLKEKNLKKRLEQREFDFTKFWSMSDTEKYVEIKNEADKIKIKNKK